MIARTFSLLMPVLFPSWRFFMTVGPSPRVQYRIKGGVWRESAPMPAHVPLWKMAARMVFNAERNRQLYLVALAERMVATPSAHSQAELKRLLAARHGGEGDHMQFRLVFVMRDGDALIEEVIVKSDTFSAREALS